MATFNFALFAIVGFALCGLAASSESCSVATGACDSLDQADGVHVSLLQANIEHKASVGAHEAASNNWVGCCHGENCPNASTVDDPCPSECQAFYGTTGLCMGRDNDNNTCPESFDLENGEFCPQGCIVTPVNLTSSSLLNIPGKSAKENRKLSMLYAAMQQSRAKSGKHTPKAGGVRRKGQADAVHVSQLQAGIKHKASVGAHEAASTKRNTTYIGCCHGENCPNAYTADDPCPEECEAFVGTTGACMGRDDDGNTCPGTFDLENGEFCPQGCIVGR